MCSTDHLKDNHCKPVFACEASEVEDCVFFQTDNNVSCKHLKSNEECTSAVAQANAMTTALIHMGLQIVRSEKGVKDERK